MLTSRILVAMLTLHLRSLQRKQSANHGISRLRCQVPIAQPQPLTSAKAIIVSPFAPVVSSSSFSRASSRLIRVGMHFVGDHFFFRGADKTQLAMSQVVFRGERRPESAANYGAGFVEFTGALFGIERPGRARCCHTHPSACRLHRSRRHSAIRWKIAGKIGRKARDGSM